MNVYSITLVAIMLHGQHTCVAIPERRLPEAEKHSGATEQSTEKEARERWEQAIAAKGGRDKLLTVKNMIISSRTEYTTHLGKRNSWYQEELSVFPDRTWLWSDMRPDVFGLRIDMINYTAKMRYVVGPDQRKEDEIRHLTDDYKWQESDVLTTQVLYLMETSWVKPIPIAIYRNVIKKQSMDIVQTQVNGKRVDFALDPTTHLPVRVTFYGMLKGAETPIVITELSDYVEVGGIKVPKKVTAENGSTFDNKVQINVAYNEEIFTKPTTIAAGPEAWKIVKK